jgi:hypothetical protein
MQPTVQRRWPNIIVEVAVTELETHVRAKAMVENG